MNKFEKINFNQFKIDFLQFLSDYNSRDLFKPSTEESMKVWYDTLKLPVRATKHSAGYDIYSPLTFTLNPGATIKIPAGIRVLLDSDKFLMIVPRSSLGFKYRLQLDNTVAIIDADYSNSNNEGHIWLKLTNNSKDGKTLHIERGSAIAQGIVLPFIKTEDDNTTKERNGGFGSTDAKKRY